MPRPGATAIKVRNYRMTYYIYVLRLDGGNYYVGLTSGCPSRRIEQHGGRHGAAWTRLHHPLELVETIDTRTTDQTKASLHESMVTWKYMQRYGWQRVRGGYFCACDEEATRKNLEAHGFFEAPLARTR